MTSLVSFLTLRKQGHFFGGSGSSGLLVVRCLGGTFQRLCLQTFDLHAQHLTPRLSLISLSRPLQLEKSAALPQRLQRPHNETKLRTE